MAAHAILQSIFSVIKSLASYLLCVLYSYSWVTPEELSAVHSTTLLAHAHTAYSQYTYKSEKWAVLPQPTLSSSINITVPSIYLASSTGLIQARRSVGNYFAILIFLPPTLKYCQIYLQLKWQLPPGGWWKVLYLKIKSGGLGWIWTHSCKWCWNVQCEGVNSYKSFPALPGTSHHILTGRDSCELDAHWCTKN